MGLTCLIKLVKLLHLVQCRYKFTSVYVPHYLSTACAKQVSEQIHVHAQSLLADFFMHLKMPYA